MTTHRSPALEVVACPFCDSTEATQVRTIADIVQCKNCSTVYLRSRLSEPALYALYQNYAHEGSHMRLPRTEEEVASSGLRRTTFIEEVLQYIAPDGIWLDVGCGWGALLDEARQRGFVPRGIELTRACVDFATMVLGIPVSNSDLLESSIPPQSCSVISMVHVLEHLPRPRAELQKVYQSLCSGGIFCGIVPNFDSLCSELLDNQWAWLDPNYHYVHYTPATLKQHLQSHGFRVEHLYTATGDYGEEVVLNYIEAVMPSLPTSVSPRDLLRAVEADGRGEEIRFIVRKV